MFGNHWVYIVILLIIVLIIFGPGKLPDLGSAVGKAINEFRRASTDLKDEVSKSVTPTEPERAVTTVVEETPKPKSEPTKS